MHSAIVLGVAALAGLSAGQATPQANYPYRIDPNSVLSTDRAAWCGNQRAQCPLICLQQPGVTSLTTLDNECDPDTLIYSCVCDNGIAPNITQYSQTLPFYICQAWGTQCVTGCNGDNTCSDKCRADHPCGAQSPYRGNTSIPTTSSARPTGSGAATKIPVTGFGGAQATTGSSPSNTNAGASFVPNAALSMAGLCATAFLGFAVFL